MPDWDLHYNTEKRRSLVFDGNGHSPFFDFNDDVENSETVICGEMCPRYRKKHFVSTSNGYYRDQLYCKFEVQNESWLDSSTPPSLSFGEEGGATIAFSCKSRHTFLGNINLQ